MSTSLKKIKTVQRQTLQRDFYLRPTEKVARDLVGKILVVDHGREFKRKRYARKVSRYKIVETEAYLGLKDPACHSYHGKKTSRVEVMYKSGGHAYVYLIYGVHHCFNIVTGPENQPDAVLIRAVTPLEAEEPSPFVKGERYSGPGNLCRELGIDMSFNQLDLTVGKKLWLEESAGKTEKRFEITAGPRVGIRSRGESAKWPLRFFYKDHPAVSKYRP